MFYPLSKEEQRVLEDAVAWYDGESTWDIFHMSKRTYLAHCNRVSGPGSDDEP